MRITRLLLLGAIAPLAFTMPAFAEQGGAAGTAVPAEIVAAPADAATAATPAAQPAPRARHTVALGPEGTDEQGRTGRVHTVVRGDTLWDISEAYLGTPWVWPSIWKENPRVANPNRIYPGNRIWIAPGEMRQLSEDETVSLSSGSQPPASTGDASVQPMRIQEVPNIEQIGFVTAEQIETAGALLDSPDPEKMLSANRRAYIGLGEGQVEVGDQFTIVRENEKVRDPETNRVIGTHVDKLGWLEVTKVGAEASEAMIRVSYEDILRGDRLIPRVDLSREVPVHAAAADVEGQIAMNPRERDITAHFDVVYLNRGTDHGIEVGNPLEVYRPGAVAVDDETKVKHVLPDEVVANLLVVSANADASVALVTTTNVELNSGNFFRSAESENTSHRAASSAPLEGTQWTARTIEKGNGGQASAPPAKAAPLGAGRSLFPKASRSRERDAFAI
jgi:hypothetical protein